MPATANVATPEAAGTPDGAPDVLPVQGAGAAAESVQPQGAGVEMGEDLLPHDLSPWGMFMAAHYIVKSVMIGLALASMLTWIIWVAKSLELAFARASVRRTLKALREASSLVGAARQVSAGKGPAATAVHAALKEWEVSGGLTADGIKERVAIALNRIEAAAGRRISGGTGLLATIGAVAPFVGLFGTVWGIMNAFIGISKAHTTNLAVVAPGIAEALLATAIGLVAAIPAVVIYNVFARAISSYKASLADASAEVMRHLSRDLDRAAGGEAVVLRAAAE